MFKNKKLNKKNDVDTHLIVGKKFWDWEIFKIIINKSVPTILGAMLIAIIPLVDNIFAAFFKDIGVAAVSYALNVQFIFFVIVLGVNGSIGVVLAQYYGAKNYDNVRHAHKLKMLSSLVFAFLSLFFFLFLSEQLLGLYSTDAVNRAEILEMGKKYLQVLGIINFFYFINEGYANSLPQLGKTKIILVTAIAAIFANALLDWLFISIFDFDLVGLAYATLIVNIILWLIYEFYIRFTNSVIAFNWLKVFHIHKVVFFKSLQRWHMILSEVFFSFAIFAVNVIIARSYDSGSVYGTINGIVGIFQKLMFASIGGFYGSVAFFCGKYLGADLLDEAYINAKRIAVVSVSIGVVLSMIFCLFAPLYVNLLFPDVSELNRHEAVMVLQLYPLVLPPFLLGILGYRILEAGGQTKTVMLFDFVHNYVVVLFLGWIIFAVWNPEDYWLAWLVSALVRYTRAFFSVFFVYEKLWLVNLIKHPAKEPQGLTYLVLAVSTLGFYPLFEEINKIIKKRKVKDQKN